MAQTKRKRRSKHRGTAVGTIESRGRTGRPPSPSERKAQTRQTAAQRRVDRLNRPPSWRSAAYRAGAFAVVSFAVFALVGNSPTGAALVQGAVVGMLCLPMGYYTDAFMYRRHQRKLASGTAARR